MDFECLSSKIVGQSPDRLAVARMLGREPAVIFKHAKP
jgi:hypothetical protein